MKGATVARRKRKVYKRRDNPYKDYRFVVFKSKIGRTEPGVYERRVTVDKKIAFVHPPEGQAKADIIPAAHVFTSKRKANTFFASEGHLQWVIFKDDDGVPEVVQARVESYVTKRYRGWSSEVQVISRVDGKDVEWHGGMTGFKTEKEALRHFLSKMDERLDEVDNEIKKHRARRAGLLKIQRRIRRLGVRRPLKEEP